jgi:hypothetical protein
MAKKDLTPEQLARRKERAQEFKNNYATDADRALVNKRGTQGRNQERKDAWAKDGFDLNTFGKGHVSGSEMKQMRTSGMSSAEIEEMSAGMHMTDRATKQLNRKKAREKAVAARNQTPDPVEAPPMNTDTPGTPTPTIPPGLGNQEPALPDTIGNQLVTGDTGNVGKVGDMTTTIGDGNTIIGSPIGNDYSVTIGNTGNTNGGGTTGGGSGLSNMMGAAAYSALNDNAYAKSQSQLNGYGRAAGAIAQGELATGASDRVANLYNMVGESQNYWNNKANAQRGMYLGDTWNGGGHDWVQAPNPESSKDNTEEILNGDDDD